MPFFTVFRGLAVGMLLVPVLMVLTAWLQWDGASALVWQGLLDTVLPDYTATSLLLCALVAIGVVSIGSVSAAAVTLFEFPGRQALSWLLLLPLAMSYGIDPIHFGIIFLANLEMGFLCPPAGMNIYFASAVFNKSLKSVVNSVLPALMAIFIGTVLISWFPMLVMTLPKMVFPSP